MTSVLSIAKPLSAATTETRQRIVAAAIDSFSRRGFHATTTRDISVGAGLSPAAMYVHYPSKEELLYEITREGHEHTLQCILAGAASSPDPTEALVAAVRGFILSVAHNQTRARVITYELAALDPAHLRAITVLRRSGERAVRKIVEAGVASGAFTTSDVRMTTLAILSLAIDVARWYRADGRWTPARIVDHYAELSLRIVCAKPARKKKLRRG